MTDKLVRWPHFVRLTFSVVLVAAGRADWNPGAGQWGKTDPDDLRVMTYNIRDTICSSSTTKVEGLNDWCALARIVAAMKPDILILQETGDNDGNGTGSGVDSVSNLTTTLNLFLHGGNDPFRGNVPVTAWVQKYDPAYDLPHVFVSGASDAFNRNVVLSRFPFQELNGDFRTTYSDIPGVNADLYAPGGNGGIRGFQFAEINLPDGPYTGNLAIGNAHLKAGSNSQDFADRLRAAQNVAYVIDYWYNGGGAGVPDPRNRIADAPAAQTILAADTPVIIGGDWNEDELINGRRGPAEWLTRAELNGGTDGTDRDRSDMTFDDARNVFTNSRNTLGSVKFDYIAWQDSIVTLRRAFVFNTSGMSGSQFPPELAGYPSPTMASQQASDHLPVIADFILPMSAPCEPCDTNCDGSVNAFDIQTFVDMLGPSPPPGCSTCAADANGDGSVNAFDIQDFVNCLNG